MTSYSGHSFAFTWAVLSILYGCMVVSVETTPSIDVGPSSYSTTLVYGSESTTSIYLSCRVSNLERDDVVAWFKSGRQISENDVLFQSELTDLNRYNIVGMYNLQIYSFSSVHAIKDSGKYWCEVFSKDYTAQSDIAAVTINVIPGEQYPICRQLIDGRYHQGKESMYFTGDNVTLQCLSDPRKPAVILKWFRNYDSVPLNTWVGSFTDLFVYAKNSYTLDLSTEETGTTFTCQLSLKDQKDRHCTVGPITIYDEPTINIYPEVTEVRSPDQTVTFTCKEASNGPSVQNYHWRIGNVGNTMEFSGFETDHLSGNKTIRLRRLEIADNGEYNVTCSVDYRFTSRDVSATLLVNISSTLPLTTDKFSTKATFSSEMTITTVEKHTYFDQFTPDRMNSGDMNLKTPSHPDRQSHYTFKTGILLGVILGVFILVSLIVILIFVYVYKRREHKQNDGQEMATQSDYANVIANRYVETTDYANTHLGQKAEKSARVGDGRVWDDGYANLTVDGRDGSITSVYSSLNLVDSTNRDSNQGRVGDDGYALVNLASREGDAKTVYAQLAPVTDESSDVKSELVGDDGYANLATRRHEGDSDPSYAQLSYVGERK